MNDDDERAKPGAESTDAFDEVNRQSAPAVVQNRWTLQDVLVRALIAVVIVLIMVGALLLILQNAFHVLSS